MNNENNAAQAKHLDSTAVAIKRYLLAQIVEFAEAIAAELDNVTGGTGEIILDKNPSIKDGKLWYDVSGETPVLKLQYNSSVYTFNSDSSAVISTIRSKPEMYISMIPFGIVAVKPKIYISMIPAAEEE